MNRKEVKTVVRSLIMLIGAFVIAGIGIMLLALFFSVQKYKIDYCGNKQFFDGAKNSYRAGKRVRMYYSMIATDTTYDFFVDGKQYNPDFDDDKGFIIEFTMPSHNITVDVKTKNISAVYP